MERLLPAISARFEDIQANQEDWGWFIWFRRCPVSLAVDIFCDDPQQGKFRLHLTSSIKRWLLFRSMQDTSALEEVRQLVVDEIKTWVGSVNVTQVLSPSSTGTEEARQKGLSLDDYLLQTVLQKKTSNDTALSATTLLTPDFPQTHLIYDTRKRSHGRQES